MPLGRSEIHSLFKKDREEFFEYLQRMSIEKRFSLVCELIDFCKEFRGMALGQWQKKWPHKHKTRSQYQ